ncbi:hypothetical protein GW755_02965 [bacterium]|nr:hypothetical protein [bacterium]
MKFVFLVLLTLSSVIISPKTIFANTSIDYGICDITPNDSSSSNPKITGDTFLTTCSGALENGNKYDYTWTNKYSEKVNLISITFNSNPSLSYWVLNNTNNVYMQGPFDLLNTYSVGENMVLKFLLAPNSNVAAPKAVVNITFRSCTDNKDKTTCREIGQEVLDLTAQANLLLSNINLSESSINFDDLEIGSSNDKSFNITNSSNIDLVAKVIKSGGSKDGFSVTNDLLSKLDTADTITIGAGGSTTYTVTFSPSSKKDYKLQMELKPKDAVMAKYVTGKSLTFKGSGIKALIPINLNIENVNQSELDGKKEFLWKLSGTGDVKDLPWTLEIPTSCESKGLENGGSFKWKISQFSIDKPFEFKNSIEARWEESNVPVTLLVKDKNGLNLLSQEMQAPSCYSELPQEPVGVPLNDPPIDSPQDSFNPNLDPPRQGNPQSQQNPNGQSSSPSFNLDSPKLDDLKNEELNLNKDVKGTSDTNLTKGFWLRLFGYIAAAAGIAFAIWYSKREMSKNIVIIPEEEVLEKNEDEPVKSIKLE